MCLRRGLCPTAVSEAVTSAASPESAWKTGRRRTLDIAGPLRYVYKMTIFGKNISQTGKGIYAEVVEDGEYNYADEQEIGSGIPPLSYGISISLAYRGFDLAVTGSGVAGNQIYSCLWSTVIPMQNTYAKLWESTWKAPGDNAAYPSVNNWSTFVNKSSFNLWNGSFFKLRQIQLGYSLPESLLRKIWTKQIRIYASLDNFVCLTNYPGLDPETVITSDPSIGVEMGAFPDPKQISFGINLAF